MTETAISVAASLRVAKAIALPLCVLAQFPSLALAQPAEVERADECLVVEDCEGAGGLIQLFRAEFGPGRACPDSAVVIRCMTPDVMIMETFRSGQRLSEVRHEGTLGLRVTALLATGQLEDALAATPPEPIRPAQEAPAADEVQGAGDRANRILAALRRQRRPRTPDAVRTGGMPLIATLDRPSREELVAPEDPEGPRAPRVPAPLPGSDAARTESAAREEPDATRLLSLFDAPPEKRPTPVHLARASLPSLAESRLLPPRRPGDEARFAVAEPAMAEPASPGLMAPRAPERPVGRRAAASPLPEAPTPFAFPSQSTALAFRDALLGDGDESPRLGPRLGVAASSLILLTGPDVLWGAVATARLGSFDLGVAGYGRDRSFREGAAAGGGESAVLVEGSFGVTVACLRARPLALCAAGRVGVGFVGASGQGSAELEGGSAGTLWASAAAELATEVAFERFTLELTLRGGWGRGLIAEGPPQNPDGAAAELSFLHGPFLSLSAGAQFAPF